MNITFFVLYCLLFTVTPGPTNIVIFSTVQNHGVKQAISFCYGATLSFSIISILCVLLNSALTSVLPEVVFYLQLIGGAYILYMAYLILNMDISNANSNKIGSFKVGFFMQFINPKVLIFCLTVFPSFVMPYYSSTYELLGFALLTGAIGSMSFFSWVLFGKFMKQFLQKYKRSVNGFLSLFLVYCAYIISGMEVASVG